MDALVIDGVHLEPGDAMILLKPNRNIAHDVFDEDRIVVRLHRDVPFVRAFQQGIHRSGR